MTSRPRLLWPWIVATVIAVPALYVASFAPACHFVGSGDLDAQRAANVFRPVALLAWKAPILISGPLQRLASQTPEGFDGLGAVLYATGYRENLGAGPVHNVSEFVVPLRGDSKQGDQ